MVLVEATNVLVARLRARPWLLTFALLLALVSEGYDLQAASFAVPAIVRAFGIPRAAAGPLLSASLLGVLFGAALLGPSGDRFGRKRLIIGGSLAYGVLSLVCAVSTNLWQLSLLRFLIGLGLGAVLPNALALASELAGPGRAATAAGLIGIGITFGGMVAGLAAAAMIPAHGWQSLFALGGVIPLVIVLVLQVLLPESPAFLARGAPSRPSWVPVCGPIALFRHGMAGQTLAMWLIFVAVLMCIYLLSGWIPLLLNQAGYSARASALVGAAYQGGGVLGGIVASLMLHRRGWDVVMLFAALACFSLGLLAWGPGSTALMAVGVLAAGFCVTGTQNAINGVGGASYPAEIRSTGLGWALGVGRLGAVAGPLVGSLAIVLGMTEARHLFALALVPLGVAGFAAMWLRGRTDISAGNPPSSSLGVNGGRD
jgi:AAHS family 4-hydroxybenzoate transporter-like MFS transporter